ncbi:type IV secretory system conjugative DNA transfer family protein [uncultured Kordia sp.]|uniref:type IV secretory system conjugative DNA transfer family protein n=1 Tax=uncultured Kordia sp. TaxID=507699 RepID=UPI002615F55B|nr:type IV secretory system conjugative DNA transfer family protein [uncultured Kordia sp.]
MKGVYIGQDKEGKSYAYDKDVHILTIAQSGAGKNTGLIMPNLLHDAFKGTKIILDLKGENSAVCSHWKEKENLGKTFRLNPWNIFDMPSINYNPFCLLDAYNDSIYEDCLDFASAIIPEKGNQSDTGEHFDEMARDFIGSFLLYMVVSDYPEVPTPSSLYESLIINLSSIDGFRSLCDQMMAVHHPDEAIKRAIKLSALSMMGVTTGGENGEFRGIKTTIAKALKAFRGKILSMAVDDEAEHSRNLLNELFQQDELHNDLYISFPQNRVNIARVWLRLVLTSFIKRLIDTPPLKPVLFVLDEFPQLGTFNLIKNNAAFLRGYGVRFWFICQNLDQLENNYGKSGRQEIVENCGVSLFFNVKDETAKYVSEKLDKYSKSIENYNTNEYRTSIERYRKTRSEVEQEQGSFVFIGQNEAVIFERVPYFKMKNLEHRIAPNPLFYGIKAYHNYIRENKSHD